jgi:hypothetical protein
MEGMNFRRLALLGTAFGLLATVGCSKTLPEQGPLIGTSQTVKVSGEYQRVALDSVDRITIEGGKLVLHGPSSTLPVDLPPSADPEQKNFTISVPASNGPVSYGSLGGRDGNDVLLFAYGTASRSFWGWATITASARTPR